MALTRLQPAALQPSAFSGLNITDGSLYPVDLSTGAPLWDTAGNLGLGVTPSSWGSSYKAIQVSAGAALIGSPTGNYTELSSNYYWDGTNSKYMNDSYASAYSQSSGKHIWYTAPSGTAGSNVTFTQAMTLNASGYLGIGTVSPLAPLHVNGASGSVALIVGNTGEATRLEVTPTSNVGVMLDITDGGSNRNMIFAISGTERVRIDSNGRVGMGLSTPSSRLHLEGSSTALSSIIIGAGVASGVNGQIAFSSGYANRKGLVWLGDGSSGHTSYGIVHEGPALIFQTASYSIGALSDLSTGWTERMRMDSNGSLLAGTTTSIPGPGTARIAAKSESSGWFAAAFEGYYGVGINAPTFGDNSFMYFYYRGNGTPVGRIYSNGSTTTYGTTSDYRMKESIQPMVGAIEKVMALKPCTYVWKSTQEASSGFIAHELQEVIPDAVAGEKDDLFENGNIKPQMVDAGSASLIATLAAAIQEQQEIIESLKARLDAAGL